MSTDFSSRRASWQRFSPSPLSQGTKKVTDNTRSNELGLKRIIDYANAEEWPRRTATAAGGRVLILLNIAYNYFYIWLNLTTSSRCFLYKKKPKDNEMKPYHIVENNRFAPCETIFT